MATAIPTVIVSSTFYDLRQVRANLTQFLETEMGYTALLSELDSFPIDPGLDTIENCRRQVETEADVLVLIIGGSYGQVDAASAKSVTNLEYLATRAKGIPVYAFVQRDVLALVPVWKSNPTANFAGAVDDPRVLGFIDEVRNIHKVWTQEFDTAQHIMSALGARFANLTKEGLTWSRRLNAGSLRASVLEALRGRALRLALERPTAWEYKLLFQLVLDELHARASARRDHQFGFTIGASSHVSHDNSARWTSQRISEIRATIDVLNSLFAGPLQDSLGPPGVSGDPEKITYVAQRIGLIYAEAIEWAQRVRRTAADDLWSGMIVELAKFSEGIINGIESWAQAGYESVEKNANAQSDEVIKLTLHIELGGDPDAFNWQLDEIGRNFVPD